MRRSYGRAAPAGHTRYIVTPLESRVWLWPWQSRVEEQEESEKAIMVRMLAKKKIRFMCSKVA